MAWGSQTQVDPKEIIGMTPDELKGSIDKIGAVESKMTEFQDNTSKQLTALMEKIESLTPKPKETPDPALDFLTDPEGSIEKRMAPFEKQTLDNTIMLRHRDAREAHPKDFERWGGEIVQKMGELSAQQQADPRVWNAMVLMVRGTHAGEIEKDGATGKFAYLEPVSAGLRPDPKTADGLTNAERHMVNKLAPFGVTAEKYARGQKRLTESRAARLGSFAGVEN
jgi:hypothetical protein